VIAALTVTVILPAVAVAILFLTKPRA